MKKKTLLALGLSMCLILSACGKGETPPTEGQQPSGSTSGEGVDGGEGTNIYPEDIAVELGDSVVESVEAFIAGEGFLPYLSERENPYVTEELLIQAMKESEQFRPLVISDELEMLGYEKQTKEEFTFTFVNEMETNVTVSFLKEGEGWYMDISPLLTNASFRVPSNMDVKINGVPVTQEDYSSGTNIDVKGVLKGVPTTVSYSTGLFKNYKQDFVCNGDSGLNDARYLLIQDDIDALLPQVESLWRSIQTMVVSGEGESYAGLFAADSRANPAMVISAWNASSNTPPGEVVLQGLDTNKSEGVVAAYLESKDVIALNLTGSFLKIQGVVDSKVIPNWVKIQKTENQVKLYDCSAEVWLGSGF